MLKLLNSNKILHQATIEFLALPESKQKRLKESLDNGKALLKSENQMWAYLHHYGEIHRQKLILAFKGLPENMFNRNISIIDWGWGYI